MPAPDADTPTTHIRCGSDIRETLREAGFGGDFLEYSDPICQGPVPDRPDLAAIRARFVAGAYPGHARNVAARLAAEEAALTAVAASDRRLVLWCEHDPYDQLLLARALDRLPDRVGLELICIDRHPRPARFIGLGQLLPEDLVALWPQRRTITADHRALGRAVWLALRQSDPSALHAIAESGTAPVPPMQAALRRHLQELPWRRDGLSLTERLILQAVRDGAATMGRVFGEAQRLDPLPFLGDVMIVPIIEGLAAAAIPALDLGGAPRWAERPVALTGHGARLLEGQADWQQARPNERWVGGVRIAPDAPAWRWDGRPVPF